MNSNFKGSKVVQNFPPSEFEGGSNPPIRYFFNLLHGSKLRESIPLACIKATTVVKALRAFLA